MKCPIHYIFLIILTWLIIVLRLSDLNSLKRSCYSPCSIICTVGSSSIRVIEILFWRWDLFRVSLFALDLLLLLRSYFNVYFLCGWRRLSASITCWIFRLLLDFIINHWLWLWNPWGCSLHSKISCHHRLIIGTYRGRIRTLWVFIQKTRTLRTSWMRSQVFWSPYVHNKIFRVRIRIHWSFNQNIIYNYNCWDH